MIPSDVIDEIYKHFVASDYQICTDSRALKAGDVFFCIKGERFDGNAFAEEAIKLGARLVVVDAEVYSKDSRFTWVADTTLALQLLKYIITLTHKGKNFGIVSIKYNHIHLFVAIEVKGLKLKF